MHKRYCGIISSLWDAAICRFVMHVTPVRSGRVIVGDESIWCVDEFCYLGDMISAGVGAEVNSVVRV